MMKNNKKNPSFEVKKIIILILQSVAFIIFGYFFNDDLLATIHETSISDGFAFIFYVLLLALTFAWTLYEVIRDYQKNKIPFGVISILIGIGTCIFLYSTYYQIEKLDSSPIYLRAAHDSGDDELGETNAVLTLRKDNTYLITSYNFMGHDCFRGTYTIQDNLIVLDKKDIIRYVINSRRLLIQKNPTKEGFIIHQVDKNLNIIENDYPFVFKDYNFKSNNKP